MGNRPSTAIVMFQMTLFAQAPTDKERVSLVEKCSLRYLKRKPAATDFDTWNQAATALEQGVSVHEIVVREYERTYGAGSVKSVTVVKDISNLEGMAAKYEKCGAPCPCAAWHALPDCTRILC